MNNPEPYFSCQLVKKPANFPSVYSLDYKRSMPLKQLSVAFTDHMENNSSSEIFIPAQKAKGQLSSLVKKVIAGNTFVITDDETGEPIAELVPVVEKETEIE